MTGVILYEALVGALVLSLLTYCSLVGRFFSSLSILGISYICMVLYCVIWLGPTSYWTIVEPNKVMIFKVSDWFIANQYIEQAAFFGIGVVLSPVIVVTILRLSWRKCKHLRWVIDELRMDRKGVFARREIAVVCGLIVVVQLAGAYIYIGSDMEPDYFNNLNLVQKYCALSIYALGWTPSILCCIHYGSKQKRFDASKCLFVMIIVFGQLLTFTIMNMRTNAIVCTTGPLVILFLRYASRRRFVLVGIPVIIIAMSATFSIVTISSKRLDGEMRKIHEAQVTHLMKRDQRSPKLNDSNAKDFGVETKIIALNKNLFQDLMYRSAVANYSATFETLSCTRDPRFEAIKNQLPKVNIRELLVNDFMSSAPSELMEQLGINNVRTNAYRSLRTACYKLIRHGETSPTPILDMMDAKGQELILLLGPYLSILTGGIGIMVSIVLSISLFFIIGRFLKVFSGLWTLTIFTAASTVGYGAWLQLLITTVPVLIFTNSLMATFMTYNAVKSGSHD
jgi:hypothetical protein